MSTKSVTLTMYFHTNQSTLTEMHPSIESAADVVLDISNVMNAEIFPADLSTFGHQGHLYRNHPDGAVVATYEIEEN